MLLEISLSIWTLISAQYSYKYTYHACVYLRQNKHYTTPHRSRMNSDYITGRNTCTGPAYNSLEHATPASCKWEQALPKDERDLLH